MVVAILCLEARACVLASYFYCQSGVLKLVFFLLFSYSFTNQSSYLFLACILKYLLVWLLPSLFFFSHDFCVTLIGREFYERSADIKIISISLCEICIMPNEACVLQL